MKNLIYDSLMQQNLNKSIAEDNLFEFLNLNIAFAIE